VLLGQLPMLSLLALLPALLSLIALKGAVQHRQAIGSRPAYMAANVGATLLTPLLLGITLVMS
jgi:1,4-dihydroxy-2-naphthoate octaprenyltransferase